MLLISTENNEQQQDIDKCKAKCHHNYCNAIMILAQG